MDPAEAPILVLGSGQRCGSTLVQRLLTSHPEVIIWGEHGGHLRDLLAMTHVLEQWDANVAEHGRRAFAQEGHDGWIANMLPGGDALRAAAHDYLLALFGAPAAAQGRPRWGFKEVRFGRAEATGFRRLFPALTAIHVTRDPRDVLVSLDAWEREQGWWRREFTVTAIRDWAAVTDSFLGADEPWLVTRRYEDVVADPNGFIADVAELIGTGPAMLDASVFERKVAGYAARSEPSRSWSELPADLRALLDDGQVRDIAERAGYALA